MPVSGAYLPDESSLSRVQTDPEGSLPIWGTDAAVLASPQGSQQGGIDHVLQGNIIPPAGYVASAYAIASAPGQQQLSHEPDAKYADELMEDLFYTVAPTPGILDGDKGAVLSQGYDPYLTKEPKLRGNEQPTTDSIVSNVASSPAQGLVTTEQGLMSLLFDF